MEKQVLNKNWFAVFLVYVPIALILGFGLWGAFSLHGQGFLGCLREWQSLVGSLISVAIAVGLFQWQRARDICDQKEDRRSLILGSLSTIGQWHSDKLLQFSEGCKKLADRIPDSFQDAPEVTNKLWAAKNRLIDIYNAYERAEFKLQSLPRDRFVSASLRSKFDELEKIVAHNRNNVRIQISGTEAVPGGIPMYQLFPKTFLLFAANDFDLYLEFTSQCQALAEQTNKE